MKKDYLNGQSIYILKLYSLLTSGLWVYIDKTLGISTEHAAYQHSAKKKETCKAFIRRGLNGLSAYYDRYCHLHRCVSLDLSHPQMTNDSRRLRASTVVGDPSRLFVSTSAHPQLAHGQIGIRSALWRRCIFHGSLGFCVDDRSCDQSRFVRCCNTHGALKCTLRRLRCWHGGITRLR